MNDASSDAALVANDSSVPDSNAPVDAGSREDRSVPDLSLNDAAVDHSASDAMAPEDAAVGDARRVTYEGEVRPILRERCGACHTTGSSALAESYAYTQQQGHSWCSGELVGDCIERHARGQEVRQPMMCGSALFYHRDWVPCMSEEQRALVLQWHRDGMPER